MNFEKTIPIVAIIIAAISLVYTYVQKSNSDAVKLNTVETKVNSIEKYIQEIKGYAKSPLAGQRFCVLQSGKNCPSGFSNGSICIDSEDYKNKDFVSGIVGESGKNKCGGSSKSFLLCCK